MYALPARNKKILVRKIRHYKKLCFPGKGSGARLADEIGVPPQTVSNWLNGSRTPTSEQLYRLAVAFGVSPLELCGIPEEEPQGSAAVYLLRELLNVLEYHRKNHVNPRVTLKEMNTINTRISKVMEGIEKIRKRKRK